MYRFGRRSKENLATIHDDLQLLANAVIEHYDCSLISGHRGEEEQNILFARKVSKVKYPNSKHNAYPSNAMDLVPYERGRDPYEMEFLLNFSAFVIDLAKELHVVGLMDHQIRWGGDWDSDGDWKDETFFDGAHFELVPNL